MKVISAALTNEQALLTYSSSMCVQNHVFPAHQSVPVCVRKYLSETSAPPLLSSAIVLRMCTLYLGMRGIGESREGHCENVNELNESADPNVGCALSYIKATFEHKDTPQCGSLCFGGELTLLCQGRTE